MKIIAIVKDFDEGEHMITKIFDSHDVIENVFKWNDYNKEQNIILSIPEDEEIPHPEVDYEDPF